ncbi:DUF6765 family protein [Thermodesulfobacteriota bacterium B35]
MQLDMHYYGVYALARAAGMKPKSARIVAQASQFVDDALDDKMIYLDSDVAVLPLPTSHKPLDYANTIAAEQWKIWVPFHFLPGNNPDSTTFTERLVCRKNSPLAKKICTFAVDEGGGRHGLHLLGVVCHVFADTFSHHGFIGLNREWNRIINTTLRATQPGAGILHLPLHHGQARRIPGTEHRLPWPRSCPWATAASPPFPTGPTCSGNTSPRTVAP